MDGEKFISHLGQLFPQPDVSIRQPILFCIPISPKYLVNVFYSFCYDSVVQITNECDQLGKRRES